MRVNTNDLTLVRNYLQKYQFYVKEYELVKQKNHPVYKTVTAFYKANDLDRRNFLKYYNRFTENGRNLDSFLPQKRGPKWKTRRTPAFIEQRVLELRGKGNNRYEISAILKPRYKKFAPSPSTVYAICRRYGKNRLTTKMAEEKRQIIKEKAGELAHIDTHYLNKGIIHGDNTRLYLVGVIDSCTRLAWVEITKDIKSLTVMFATMRCFQNLSAEHNITFQEALTDNGAEFGPKQSKKKEEHPFERMLMEMDIKHRYIRPYRPQTNGKIERFWKTIEIDLLQETYFESIEHLQQELIEYLYYYNQHRPHQGLNGKTPNEVNLNSPRIT